MKDVKVANNLIGISNRAGQIASLACAISNAAMYAPDSLEAYQEALTFFATAMRELANDLKTVVTS